jgi:hypothetical protein
MHDTAVPTANFLQDPNERSREAGRASLARLRYDSFQLLSSGTMHDVRKPSQIQEEEE